MSQNLETKTDSEFNENKIEFKILSEYLENLRKSNESFQTNILKELKQMRELMTDVKKSIDEMPIRFADAMTQCLESVQSRSDILSVDSEPEMIDIFDKIDVSKDCEDIEICDKTCFEVIPNPMSGEKSGSTVKKFVFEYNPHIDLDKWLKKE